MKLFVDSANVADIRRLAETGLVDGVTTNPTLIAKAGKDFKKTIAEIAALIEGPVSAEVAATDADGMISEGKALARIARNVCIKLPLTTSGVTACKALSAEGLSTNVTLCFSENQALLAAKAGATFVSPFVGRLDDVGASGSKLIREIRRLFDQHAFETQILAASIRSAESVSLVAKAGANAATIPPHIFSSLFLHPLTDQGLAQFLNDWKKSGQKIL